MAGKTREIKGRIKAVANIQRITKTMQMIATAKFQSALKKATAAKPYTEKIAELVAEVAKAQSGEVTHPMLRQPSGGRELLLVITSNRGLCGAYNANVLREAQAFLKGKDRSNIDLEVVGKKGVAYFKFAEQDVAKVHTDMPDEPAYEHVEPLASRYMDQFIDGTYDAVHVAYMAFQSVSKQNPTIATLMPLEGVGEEEGDEATTGPSAAYEFSPDPQELLDELLPATVKARLFQAFNEANVSEQIGRMVAMKAATDAAGKMGKNLKREYNRARQAAITTELSEIIAGAAAL